MKKVGSITLMLCSALMCVQVSADDMPIINQWNGPYKATTIYKLADYAEGVACYIYAPSITSYSVQTSGSGVNRVTKMLYGNNNIGSISCVKVTKSPTDEGSKQ